MPPELARYYLHEVGRPMTVARLRRLQRRASELSEDRDPDLPAN
jgi:hypothetical protein